MTLTTPQPPANQASSTQPASTSSTTESSIITPLNQVRCHRNGFILTLSDLFNSPMATLIRSAMSGSDWGRNELRAYNIQVVTEDLVTFFGTDQLPPPTVRAAVLANESYPAAGLPNNDDRLFFRYMHEAMLHPAGEESAVDDFAAHLLEMIGYDQPDRLVRQRKDIPLYMCGSNVHAKTDVCVVDCSPENKGILLLVQEDKRYLEQGDPEPQVIAEAIAAFQTNNLRRARAGQPTVNAQALPAITMTSTAPTFYKVDVTSALIEAIESAQYPEHDTIVHKLVPPVQRPLELEFHGMRPLDNRRIIFSCFEAFKQFL